MSAKIKQVIKRKGAALIISMIFVIIFSALAVAMAGFSGTHVQLAGNQQKINSSLSAALSGLEVGRYFAANYIPTVSTDDHLSQADRDSTWQAFKTQVQTTANWMNWTDSGSQLTSSNINFGSANESFAISYTYDGNNISLTGTGGDKTGNGNISRQAGMVMAIQRDGQVLKYSIASRGRMWITGDTSVYGDIFSSWDREEISPYNMTTDSSVYGTVNTVLSLEQIGPQDYQLETLDANGLPVDANGDPLGDNYADRYYGPDDEIKGYHQNVNYAQSSGDIPGMDISDYDTDLYNNGLTDIAGSGTIEVEYFPHASSDDGGYSMPRDGTPGSTWNRKLNRHVYENQTFTDALVPNNRNALFRNCTFEGTLYIDCNKSGSSYYNNVRFEDCQFNGAIVTDVPQQFKWKHNVLYFTGSATYDNQSDVPATILAPHFNVNLGNANPAQSDNNILTGAIVGGIVDVRGNAQIYGTIISMCDTTSWSSGYVTNIGATLDDGGSETTELGDIGTIEITPDDDKMLPSGITSPVVIVPNQNTYFEGT